MGANPTKSTLAGEAIRDRIVAHLPVEDRRLKAAGVSTAILEGGHGPPMVLLHGQGEFGATWAPVLGDLEARHRVLVPDLPGHGATGLGNGRLDRARTLQWLADLIDRTCAAPPVLAGHLLGGAITLRFAIERPDAVDRLVLVDTLGLSRFRPSAGFLSAMVRFAVRPTEQSRDRLFDQCFVDLDRVRREFVVPWEDMGTYALQGAKSKGLKSPMRALMPAFAMPAIPDEQLSNLGVPVVLIHGAQDKQVRVSVAEQASRRYGWPLHVIDGAGDDPAVEQPEEFMAAMRAALDRP